MTNALKRNFQVGERIYVVDYWGASGGTEAFKAQAKILEVNVTTETFTAVLYGDTYKTYSFKDYGRLIFDTSAEAVEAADNLPKPKTIVYQIMGKRVYKKIVEGIEGQYNNGTYDLVVRLNKGKVVPIKEIGYSLFTNESDARK